MIRTGGAAFLVYSFFGILVCTAGANAPNDPFAETQTITVADAGGLDDLGWSLDVSGGLMISGATGAANAANQSTGAAYIYRQAADGMWNQVAKLLPADGISNDSFGYAVALDGDWAIVEAGFYRRGGGSQQGATYLFHRNTDSDWQQVSEFVAPAQNSSYFSHVSVSGTQAVASKSLSVSLSVAHGIVDVIEQTGPSSWEKTQRIEIFGSASQVNDVAIENGTLAIGGYRRAVAGGPITYFVDVYKDSPNGFVPTTSILPPIESVAFGSSVALDHDRMLIGAAVEAGHGAAYIFERGPGDTWSQAAHLVPSDIDQRFLIGTQVALHGDFAYVNSWNSPNGLGDGRIYVFQRTDGGNWVEIAKLTSPQTQITFGHSLAAVDGQVLIGSGVNTPGMVHVFSQVPEPAYPSFVLLLAMCLCCQYLRTGHHRTP